MDITNNKGFVQNSESDSAVWLQRKGNNPISILFNYPNNCLGCNKSTLSIESPLQTMEPSKASFISREKSETFNNEDYEYGKKKETTLCCESDIHYPVWKSDEIYVWNISLYWTNIKEQEYSRQESRYYEDIEAVSAFCPYRIGRTRTIETTIGTTEDHISFGGLCRVGTLGIVKQMNEEKECNFVYAKREHKNDSDGSEWNLSDGLARDGVFMVVDTFVDESVRRNIAVSIHFTLVDSKDLETLNYFYEFVAEYGFEHIIVIGEIHYGMLFLDCYGRVFQWDETEQALWPLGNSLKEVESKMESNKNIHQVLWIVEDDDVAFYTVPDYDSEKTRNTRAVKGVKNKHSKKNKKKKK